jgi:hypothetical protein
MDARQFTTGFHALHSDARDCAGRITVCGTDMTAAMQKNFKTQYRRNSAVYTLSVVN